MDKKSTLILVVSFALLVLWYPLVNRLYPPQPLPGGTNSPAFDTNGISGDIKTGQPLATSIGAPRTDAFAPIVATNRPTGPEQTMTLATSVARYTFTSRGGGLKWVELMQYPATVACGPGKEQVDTNQLAMLNTKAPVAAFTLLGGQAIEGNGEYSLSRTPDGGIRAEKVLTNGLVITKEFRPGTNFLLTATVRLDNKSGQPLRVPELDWVFGTSTPLTVHDNGLLMGIQWFNNVKAESVGANWFANRSLGCGLLPSTPRTDYVVGASNVFWGSAYNQFFAMVAIPKEPALQFHARQIELPEPTLAEIGSDPKTVMKPIGFQASLRYPAQILATNQVVEHKMELFSGPKEYNTLRVMGKGLDQVMNFGFWGWFSQILLWSLNSLNGLGFNYGVAIITITVLIKLAFWPLTNASTKSMKRMSELQPQMKALQEKYKDDPKKMNTKLMEFMKENKVSPLGGCLPMLLQIPVFFGFYTMLQNAIELRGAHFLWACDLSQPDTVWVIPGLNFPVNIFPLMMAVSI